MLAELAIALACALHVSPAGIRAAQDEPVLLKTSASELRIKAFVERSIDLEIPELRPPFRLAHAFVAPDGAVIAINHSGRAHRWSSSGEYELCFEDPPFGTAFDPSGARFDKDGTLRRWFGRTGEHVIELVARYSLDGQLLGVDPYVRAAPEAVRRSDGGRWLVGFRAVELESPYFEPLMRITRRPDGKPLRALSAFDVGRGDELLVIDFLFDPGPPCLAVPGERAPEPPVDRSEYICEYDARGRGVRQWELHEGIGEPAWYFRLETGILVVTMLERRLGLLWLEPSTGELRTLVFDQPLEGKPSFAGFSPSGTVRVVTRYPERLYEIRLPETLR